MRASSIAVSLGTLTFSSLVRSSYASQNNSGDDSDTGGMSDLLLAIVIVLCAFSLLLVLLTSYFALKLWWILSSTREEKRKSKRIECANNMSGRKFRWVRYGGSPLGRGSFGEVFRAMIVEPLCNCGQSFKHIKHKSGAACFLCLEPQMENESWPGCETCQTRVCNLCFETPCGKQMAVKQVIHRLIYHWCVPKKSGPKLGRDRKEEISSRSSEGGNNFKKTSPSEHSISL